MKIQQISKVLIVAASITCVSYTVHAQSAGIRAVSRSTAVQSAAEQVRKDANGIHCRHVHPYVTGNQTPALEDHSHQMWCKHGGTRKVTFH